MKKKPEIEIKFRDSMSELEQEIVYSQLIEIALNYMKKKKEEEGK